MITKSRFQETSNFNQKKVKLTLQMTQQQIKCILETKAIWQIKWKLMIKENLTVFVVYLHPSVPNYKGAVKESKPLVVNAKLIQKAWKRPSMFFLQFLISAGFW